MSSSMRRTVGCRCADGQLGGDRARHHTSTRELAEIASKSQPRLLVVYHIPERSQTGTIPPNSTLREIQAIYKGTVVIARDLDV